MSNEPEEPRNTCRSGRITPGVHERVPAHPRIPATKCVIISSCINSSRRLAVSQKLRSGYILRAFTSSLPTSGHSVDHLQRLLTFMLKIIGG